MREGNRVIHSVWYDYVDCKLHVFTDKKARAKLETFPRRTNCISALTHRGSLLTSGVKGRATTDVIKDGSKTQAIAERMITKYVGGLDNPIGKKISDGGDRIGGSEIVIEITPLSFTRHGTMVRCSTASSPGNPCVSIPKACTFLPLSKDSVLLLESLM
ncbi:MAG: hypothetical protein ACREBS_02345 [Nitrososphaerales archaeon]